MSKIFFNNLKVYGAKALTATLCLVNFVNISPKAALSWSTGKQTVSQTKSNVEVLLDNNTLDFKDAFGGVELAKISDDDLKNALSDLESDDKTKQIDTREKLDTATEPREVLKSNKVSAQGEKPNEGKARKFGRFVLNWGVWAFLHRFVPHFDLKQSDLKVADSCIRNYLFGKVSIGVCRATGLADKKQYDYTSKNICKKAVNLLIRLGCMVVLNRVVPEYIVGNANMERFDEWMDDCVACDESTKNLAEFNKAIWRANLNNLRWGFSLKIARGIPSLLGC